jgi:DNA-binding MarR family transcriptional regulator
MARRLPLSTLLSFALVAFTVEFDNEAEHRLPHRTSDEGGPSSAPWLISLAMYCNCLQWVPEQGIAIRALERQARTRPNWDGMRRWGYIYYAPDPSDPRPRPPQATWLAHTTAKGRAAQELMRSLLPEMEQRWRERFGDSAIRNLRAALIAMLRTVPSGLPDCMPILHYSLVCEAPKERGNPAPESGLASLALPVLLARVLLALALEFEQESPVSLAICADILRVLEAEGTLIRRIPALTGVSKESIAMGVGFLGKRSLVQVLSQEHARRGRIVLLTPAGIEVQAEYPQRLRRLEERWNVRTGPEATSALGTALETLAGDGTREGSPLFQGLEPYPEGWRAKVTKPPATLPHFPMVLHRGGYPDGS